MLSSCRFDGRWSEEQEMVEVQDLRLGNRYVRRISEACCKVSFP